jgi:four helix bundle protein
MTEYLIEEEKILIAKETIKIYNLEDRTFQFAMSVRNFIKKIQRTLSNVEYCKQLIRSSASVGANYIEANEALSNKDFYYRIKICKKEAKESKFFLKLVDIENDKQLGEEQSSLINEANELVLIFSSIIRKEKKLTP